VFDVQLVLLVKAVLGHGCHKLTVVLKEVNLDVKWSASLQRGPWGPLHQDIYRRWGSRS
jgi:hypothetical protein